MTEKRPAVEMTPGVLARKQIEQLFESGAITSKQFGGLSVDGSAFDLRLGRNVRELTEGHRPTTLELAKLLRKVQPIEPRSDAEGDYFQFESKKIYLVELDNQLQLPANISGRATGKSSIGRLDVITRLLTENSREYDVVDMGYEGKLYMLVVPQTFSIMVPLGAKLNQLRLFSGPPHVSVITRSVVGNFGTPFWHIPTEDRKSYQLWENLLPRIESLTADPTLFDLTVDLADPKFDYIYEAKDEPIGVIDLRKGPKSHDPMLYFSQVPIEHDGDDRSVVLKEGKFYIMKSKERLYVPADVAVEVIAISERIGDIRIHYAGFAHPFFGRYTDPEKKGTPLIFEVRATDMKTRLSDHSLLARIQLFRMSGTAVHEPSEYDSQELKLSSYFHDWHE